MVKATNSVFESFVFDPEILVIPDRYTNEPSDFKWYTWITQDGRSVKIKDFDDNHLVNLFKMLARTILYGRELQKHARLSYAASEVVKTTDHHLRYIGYELHLRQQAYLTKKLSNVKLKQQR